MPALPCYIKKFGVIRSRCVHCFGSCVVSVYVLLLVVSLLCQDPLYFFFLFTPWTFLHIRYLCYFVLGEVWVLRVVCLTLFDLFCFLLTCPVCTCILRPFSTCTIFKLCVYKYQEHSMLALLHSGPWVLFNFYFYEAMLLIWCCCIRWHPE